MQDINQMGLIDFLLIFEYNKFCYITFNLFILKLP